MHDDSDEDGPQKLLRGVFHSSTLIESTFKV